MEGAHFFRRLTGRVERARGADGAVHFFDTRAPDAGTIRGVSRGLPLALLVLALLAGAACSSPRLEPPARDESCASPSKLAVAAQPAVTPRPDRVTVANGVHVVHDDAGHEIAWLTEGARSAVLRGATRSFTESDTAATVTTPIWVRALPAPFDGAVDAAWLASALADTSDDALAIASQYTACAPARRDGGVRVAGTAHYGPQESSGDRSSGADFNDYLGVDWRFPSGSTETARPALLDALDCSGFVRIVWGYRLHLPLDVPPDAGAIPRRSFEILDGSPGVVVAPYTGEQITDFAPLLPGDLVFFDARADDGPRIDHVGIFVGQDDGGHRRFVSSRKSSDGPTLGDYDGASILDGTGLFARSFRAARRL